MAPMMFCQIAWMNSYRGITNLDVPVGGGIWSNMEEATTNFLPFGEVVYGYVSAQNGTINLSKLGSGPMYGETGCTSSGQVGCCDGRKEGIDVVWTATNPGVNHRVVVGWYRRATVYGHQQAHYDAGIYHFKARTVDSRLIPVNERKLKVEHHIEGGPPGQFGVWYADSKYGNNVKRSVRKLMVKADHQIFDRDELESMAGKVEVGSRPPKGIRKPWRDQRQVGVVARDPEVHAWVLHRANGQCELCRSNAPFTKRGGILYLEVHHIETLADGGPDVPGNAVALCPNCHRESHYGVRKESIRSVLLNRIGNH